jgi:DNA-binding transcriptional ArsR family regulator
MWLSTVGYIVNRDASVRGNRLTLNHATDRTQLRPQTFSFFKRPSLPQPAGKARPDHISIKRPKEMDLSAQPREVLKCLRAIRRRDREGMEVSRPAVSQHLKILKAARLVTVHTEGTRRVYTVDEGALSRCGSGWRDSEMKCSPRLRQ